MTPAAESELAASRGPGGSLLAYKPGETAKAAKEQNAEQAAQDWQSLLTLPKQRRSISHSNTIRYQIEYHHRYPRVVNAKDVKGCTFNISIQYIIQAEDYVRIRDEDRAQVVNLKESMAWNPHSFQNISLVYVVWADTGEHLTSAEEFV
ncbi:hypothetical protein CYMTET_4619 [Cymbomonas tetramitiformis]|uniref:Uncharacterized protein n=1 Tax=Cymbomonas tetramitiformis TaxID=36881 RepID=A0AAE0H2N0_9CHLO|nr:hypothetical protein CYMTET_4619 [Cymbomonas tetramitiformis]